MVNRVNEIEQSYGVHPAQVVQWENEMLEQAQTLLTKKRGPKQERGAGAPDRVPLPQSIPGLPTRSTGDRRCGPAFGTFASVTFGVGRAPVRFGSKWRKTCCGCAAGVLRPQRRHRGAVWGKSE
jgi:hypothetical protein